MGGFTCDVLAVKIRRLFESDFQNLENPCFKTGEMLVGVRVTVRVEILILKAPHIHICLCILTLMVVLRAYDEQEALYSLLLGLSLSSYKSQSGGNIDLQSILGNKSFLLWIRLKMKRKCDKIPTM
jgi:hypothetical protein